jgi:hypothetical protein
MVALLATALSRHDTLSLRARWLRPACTLAAGLARRATMIIGFLVVLAIVSPPAVSSPGYPDSTFTDLFLLACQLGVGRR